MNPTPTDPITITLIDGRQYQLRLTLGGLRRIMQACGAKSIQQLMAAEGDVVIGRILYQVAEKWPNQITSELFFTSISVETP